MVAVIPESPPTAIAIEEEVGAPHALHRAWNGMKSNTAGFLNNINARYEILKPG